MLRECSSEVLGFLKETERTEEYNDIRCFVKQENKFNIYIFTIISEDADELKKSWNFFNNDLAWFFQAKLKKDIERWNLYTIYFVRSEVDENLQYTIEQNKYCARKIVIDKFIDENNEDKFKKIITNKLFDIEIGIQCASDLENLINIIQDNDKYLFELLNTDLEDEAILDNYLMGEANET